MAPVTPTARASEPAGPPDSGHAFPAMTAAPAILAAMLGRHGEARAAFERAAALCRNDAERAFLLGRAAEQPAGPPPGGRTFGQAAREFLARGDLVPETVRSYGQTLGRLRLDLGDGTPLAEVDAERISRVFAAAWRRTSPRTWNRHRAAVRSFSAWAGTADLAAALERRRAPRERLPAMPDSALEALLSRPDVAPRERALWRFLRDSGMSATAALSLNVEDLDSDDLGRHRALLRDVAGDRTSGPVFLADRRPAPARGPDPADVCPHTGRGRLSYERAEYLFKRATRSIDPDGQGYTLRRLSR